MRVLYYNWVDYDDAEKRGGGVSVYQKNIITELAQDNSFEVFFLSSGIAYDLKTNPHIRIVSQGDGVNKYEIVNSGVLSPGHSAFASESSLRHGATVATFRGFLEELGPFDVVHFNNLEGIPANVLSLRGMFPDTRFILTLHNYFSFCPQVNLWYQEKEHCSDFQRGGKCIRCLPWEVPAASIKKAHRLAHLLKNANIQPGSRIFELAFKYGPRVKRSVAKVVRFLEPLKVAGVPSSEDRGKKVLLSLKPNVAYFRARRETFVESINTSVNKVLVVSKRVGEIAECFGLDKKKIVTSYIGTRHAENFAKNFALRRPLLGSDGELVMCYLGYMRRDKGFYFLLAALEGLPSKYAQRTKVVIAARNTDQNALQRMEKLALKYSDVLYADGYTHDQLDTILGQVSIGIVPVLWEDCLPQVAVEMYCRGIALLCSDRGGASELGGSEAFTYKAGDVRAFHAKVIAILNGKLTHEEFWKNHMKPVTVAEHVRTLKRLYMDSLADTNDSGMARR